MRLAKEGWREMLIGTAVLGAAACGLAWLHWVLTLPVAVVWVWSVAFFRDPVRHRMFAEGEMCAPADGTVTEITRLENHEAIGGPAIRIGIFLSIFNVHINRAPCSGTVRSVQYQPGTFLDARDPESGAQNEANMLVIKPSAAHVGPVVVRQVAGKIARRIICHATENSPLQRGQRFGLIKFGSRTELIVPAVEGTDIHVQVGEKVRAGLTRMLRQRVMEMV